MMAHETRRRGCDGVVCGHIHKAEIKMIDGVLYCNDGDWVESLTAMVEHFDGSLEIVHWNEIKSSAAVPARQLRITKVSVNVEHVMESTE
jgi:predicted phosphodiesterase